MENNADACQQFSATWSKGCRKRWKMDIKFSKEQARNHDGRASSHFATWCFLRNRSNTGIESKIFFISISYLYWEWGEPQISIARIIPKHSSESKFSIEKEQKDKNGGHQPW